MVTHEDTGELLATLTNMVSSYVARFLVAWYGFGYAVRFSLRGTVLVALLLRFYLGRPLQSMGCRVIVMFSHV